MPSEVFRNYHPNHVQKKSYSFIRAKFRAIKKTTSLRATSRVVALRLAE